MNNEYREFLATKHPVVQAAGFDVAPEDINPQLFHFQRDIVRRALQMGRFALFASVGTGKTAMQLEWAKHVAARTRGVVMILAPLAVTHQTIREGEKFGVKVFAVRTQAELDAVIALGLPDGAIVITNYERIHLFDLSQIVAVILDESGILKHYSKTFFDLVERCKHITYKLCATATPAPNDFPELGNHAMFLGIMHFKDVLARWFVGEGDIARKARLKGHAREDFWRWLTSWAVCITKPSDLGPEYDMPGYDLPELRLWEHRLPASEQTIERAWKEGRLMPDDAPNATSYMRVKRETLDGRVEEVKQIMAMIPDYEPVVIWVETDFEADAMMAAFPDAVEVRGSQSVETKESRLTGFSEGAFQVLITKSEIAGYGLNWQHCRKMIYAGLSFSFERWYQSLGRVYRYGQQFPVDVFMVYAETEGNVLEVLKSKRSAFAEMQAEMSAALRKFGLFRDDGNTTTYDDAGFKKAVGDNWTYYLGDCVEVMAQMPDESVDLTVTSIPFSNLYIYSQKNADVGNAENKEKFFEHMAYVIAQLHRVTTTGRCCAVHVKDLPLFQNRDEVMGIDPFSDDTVQAFLDLRVCPACGWMGSAKANPLGVCPNQITDDIRCGVTLNRGWVMQSRVTVEKDPVVEMNKTNSHGLLFKNWRERAEILRVGLPDYVLIFQKPGKCLKPITHDPADVTYFGSKPPENWRFPKLPSRKSGQVNTALPVWQNYANPVWDDVEVPLVWTDINQTDVLNYMVAKSNQDERHICPLQLDLIARLIIWKSNRGDVVFDPFGGIGSTGYKALELKRAAVAIELKDEYHNLGCKYLTEVERQQGQMTMFDLLPDEDVVFE